MYVDPSKVNLSEKDIEDWLWENPGVIVADGWKITGWLGRQVNVPSGVIDLLGYWEDPSDCACPVVVELKNTEFTQASILQVCRYAADIDSAICSMEELAFSSDIPWVESEKIVVAKGYPSNQLLYEANAVKVRLCPFEVSYTVSVASQWRFKEAFIESNKDNIKRISKFLSLPHPKHRPEISVAPVDFMRKIDAQPMDDDGQST